MKKLILASASPRRRELLARLTADYSIMICHDEEHSDAEAPFLRVQELAAHKALDAAVEAAYGVDFNGDEEKIVAHLFKLYAEKTKGE